MRDKDFNNDYANKPKNFSEHLNEAVGSYSKTSALGGIQMENKDFVQISIKYQAELAELAMKEPIASAIFHLMIARMENNNTYIISTSKLSAALKRDPRTIQRALKALKEKNFIAIYFKVSNNQGNVYFINPLIACKCSAPRKQFLIEKYLTITSDANYKAKEERKKTSEEIENEVKEKTMLKMIKAKKFAFEEISEYVGVEVKKVKQFANLQEERTKHKKDGEIEECKNDSIIDMNALIGRDRIILKSDEKAQLDKLNRPDNTKIHALLQIPKLLDDMSQLQILETIEYIKQLKNQDEISEKEEEKEITACDKIENISSGSKGYIGDKNISPCENDPFGILADVAEYYGEGMSAYEIADIVCQGRIR